MLHWLTIAATIGMITVNGLANALPINSKTTGDIADGFDILFTPAGYVFSIWGLIYLALAAFTVVQALPAYRTRPAIIAIRPWYILNAAANASWIFAWHHEQFALALALMMVILGSLVAIYAKLLEWKDERAAVDILLRSTFSLYMGWISVATIANTTVVAWSLGYTTSLQSPAFTLGLAGFAAAVCAVVSLRFANPVYAGVFVWALVGIGRKHADVESLGSLSLGALGLAAVCALVMAVSSVLVFRRRSSAAR